MRYVLFAPICAALLGASTADADDASAEFMAVAPAFNQPVTVVVQAAPPLAIPPSGCDGHPLACRTAASAAIVPPLLPYHPPVLPPPATLYGYFNSPPQHLHVWDHYPREVAQRQWHHIAKERRLRGERAQHVSTGQPYCATCP